MLHKKLSVFLLFMAATALWGKEPGKELGRFTHPIQKLLLSYQPLIPPESEIQSAGRGPGAISALIKLLQCPSAKDSWTGAVVALGILGDPADAKLIEQLIAFQESGLPFGCLPSDANVKPDCRPVEDGSPIRASQEVARIVVPFSLGYILKRTPEVPTGNLAGGRSITVTSAALEKLSETTGSSYGLPSVDGHASVKWSREQNDPIAKRHNLELQLNAIQGLRLSGKPEAKNRLKRILEMSNNALVLQEALHALESFPDASSK